MATKSSAPASDLSGAARYDQPGHPPATITEFQGVRFLHLGTSWVQGAMRLSKPDAIELEYVQMMMILWSI
jgi:spermidine synthase